MDTTLARILTLPSLALRQVAGGTDVSRPVRWVAVSELVDPTPYLEGGEILLTTGMNLHADHTAELDAYVDRLTERGIVALGVAVGLTHEDIPHALVAAANRTDLPVFEVPRPTPFIAVTRAVADLIAEAEQEAVRRSLERQRSLTRAAMRPNAVQSVARELARILDGHVMVVTAKGVLLEESGRHLVSVEAVVTEVRRLRPKGLRAAASTAVGDLRLQVLPLGTSGRPQRYVGIATPGGTAPDKGVVSTAVSLLSLAHERADSAAETATRLRQEVGRLLLDGDVATADSVLTAISGSALPEALVVVCAEGTGGIPSEPLEDLGPLVHAALPDGRVVFFTAPADTDAVVEVLSEADLRVGVSRSMAPADVPAGVEDARQALERLATAPGEVGRFEHLLRTGVAALVDREAARAWAEATLAPLRAHTQARGVDLVGSLEVYLAHHGQWHPAAAELGIHRHTLRYRIRLAEQLLGLSLDSAQARMDLWFALQTVG